MKTKVLLILALMLTTFGNRLWAQDEETIDFTVKGYTNAQAVTSVNGTNCTVALSNAK